MGERLEVEELIVSSPSCAGRIRLVASNDGPQIVLEGPDGQECLSLTVTKGRPTVYLSKKTNPQDAAPHSIQIVVDSQAHIELTDSLGKPSITLPPRDVVGYEVWERIWKWLVKSDI